MDPMSFVYIAVIAVLAFLLYRQSSSHENNGGKDVAELKGFVQGLAENMNNLQKSVDGNMNSLNERVDQRLKENVAIIQRSHKSIGERIDNSSKAYASVKSELSKLEEASKRIFDVGKDISSLQDTLKAPKLRGVLGELFLEELLGDRFSKDQYTMQYSFKSGHTVDAVIHLRDGKMVPIDSKFSLENFTKLINEKDPDAKKKAKKAFASDIKKRIDEIASKYILPDEGTLNFALMYIPAENVYYEVIVRDETNGTSIIQYALEKGVFPVSPNTFAIYLTTVLSGLRGLEIEKRATEIMNYLAALKIDFGKFQEDFTLVGTHLGRAGSSYEKSEKRLSKFEDKLGSLNSGQGKEFIEA